MEATSSDVPVPILVTGGTGTLGRLVVARLHAAGQRVRVLSRDSNGGEGSEGIEFVVGDLSTGYGVGQAVDGVEVIIHCAGSAKGDEDKARHLVRAASAARVRHIVYISVVGADRVPMAGALDRAMFGYFGSKVAAEQVIAESGIPWTTLRATQFFDLSLKTAQAMARMPLISVPAGFRFQPISSTEVADRLKDLALGEPAGLVPAIAGPQIYDMAELVRGYLRAAGESRPIVCVPIPGKAAAALRAGANLAPDRAVGRLTWESFLSSRVTRRRELAVNRP
jgi:uncharacterized protein YbjT (DUF2867 family)